MKKYYTYLGNIWNVLNNRLKYRAINYCNPQLHIETKRNFLLKFYCCSQIIQVFEHNLLKILIKEKYFFWRINCIIRRVFLRNMFVSQRR